MAEAAVDAARNLRSRRTFGHLVRQAEIKLALGPRDQFGKFGYFPNAEPFILHGMSKSTFRSLPPALHSFRLAAEGEDVATNIGFGICNALKARSEEILTPQQAEAFRYDAVNAVILACESFPPWIPRDQLRQGLRALLRWADIAQIPFAERRKSLPDDGELNWRLQTLMFLAWAADASETVDRKATERRAKTIDILRTGTTA